MDKKNRRKSFDIDLISSLEEIKLSNNVNCQKSDTNKIKLNITTFLLMKIIKLKEEKEN